MHTYIHRCIHARLSCATCTIEEWEKIHGCGNVFFPTIKKARYLAHVSDHRDSCVWRTMHRAPYNEHLYSRDCVCVLKCVLKLNLLYCFLFYIFCIWLLLLMCLFSGFLCVCIIAFNMCRLMCMNVCVCMFTEKLKFHHCSCESVLLTSIVNVFVYLLLFECLSEVSEFFSFVWSRHFCTHVLNRLHNTKSNFSNNHTHPITNKFFYAITNAH